MSTILVVGEDTAICRSVQRLLVEDGHEAVAATRPAPALAVLGRLRPDLVILDLDSAPALLPSTDTLGEPARPTQPAESGVGEASAVAVDRWLTLRTLRAYTGVPVIAVGSCLTSADPILAFEAGADDYVATPFSPRVLAARVRALLRRAPHKAIYPPRTGPTDPQPEAA
jgi:two-component system catabolic regulation response regulator CreB